MKFFWRLKQSWTNSIFFISILVLILLMDLGITLKSKEFSNKNFNSTTLLRNAAKNNINGGDVRLMYNQNRISKNNVDNSFNIMNKNEKIARRKRKRKEKKSKKISSVEVKSTQNENLKLAESNDYPNKTKQHVFNHIDNTQHQMFHNHSKNLLNQQELNLQRYSQHLELQQQHIKQLQLLKDEHRRLLADSPIKECTIKSGQSVYHVTVVRGNCCMKKSSYDDNIQSDQPLRNRGYHDHREYQNNVMDVEDGGVDFSSKSTQNIDYFNGRNNGRYKNEPNRNMYSTFQRNNDRHSSFVKGNKPTNYFNHTTQETNDDANDFESVFMLDKLSKVEKQIFESRREMKGKINRLMHSVKKNNVEKHLKVQQQQLLKLQQQLKESYKNLSEQQEKQQKQQMVELMDMREDYLDQMKKQQTVFEQNKLLQEQYHEEKVKIEEERRKLEEEKIKHEQEKEEEKQRKEKEKQEEEKSEKEKKEKEKIEKEKQKHVHPFLQLNTDDNNSKDSFNIIDNKLQATKVEKYKNNFQRKLKLLKSKKHAGFNQELNSDLLMDDPGRHEHWLNMLHQSFATLRKELISVKERLQVTELRLREETLEKDRYRGELEISQQDLQLTKQDLQESVQLQEQTAKNLSDALTWKEHLEEKLDEEIQKHEEARSELTHVLESYERLEEENQQQTLLIGIIRNRLNDCINNQLTLHCEFEDGRLCGFVQDNYSDHLDWVRTNGNKKPDDNDALEKYGEVIGKMRETRPISDHTCGCKNGHFMHVKATEKLIGQVARMKTTRMFGFEEQCIEFYYWVAGKFVGTLNVYTEVPDEGLLSSVWRVFGDQGNVWIRARLDIPIEVVRAGYKVVFEGILDRGLLGDIAIDDFKVLPGNCTTIDF